jgi:hypothetical protein
MRTVRAGFLMDLHLVMLMAFTTRFCRVLILLVVALGLMVQPVQAQEASPSGTVTLAAWPDTLAAAPDEAFETSDYQLLPRLDALTMEYRYAGTPDGIDLSFVLSWTPGAEGRYGKQVLPYDQLPPDIRMVSVELLADVIVEGRDVADMVVAVDSMALPSHPSVYAFEVRDLAYDAVFLDTPADSARQYVAEGFELRNLAVNRIAFASFGERSRRAEPNVARDEPPRSPRPQPPRSVYVPRTTIFVGWRIGPTPYYVGRDRTRRTVQPRGESVGRTTAETDRQDTSSGRSAPPGDEAASEGASTDGEASGRSTQGGRSGDGEKRSRDRDDDEDSLLPASAAAVAVVGAAAIIGGTVGVHGTGRTPLGLTAGWVRPPGGALVQASINPAVLDADGRQHLEAKLVGFYDVLGGPVQPAVGLGAMATAEGDNTDIEPSIMLGLAGNLGRVVLLGGYDVVQGTPEFGLAINFKFRSAQ